MTAFTELVGCTVPVQQAGFGGALNVELARAVSAAGGLGMLGGALAGADALVAAIDAVRRDAPLPVGVNFVEPFFDRAAHAGSLAVAARAATLVEFFYGEPDAALVQAIHAGGALASWQVGSVAEARRAEACGVDVVILQGVEAGGHVRATHGLLPMLAEAVDVVAVPVVAAGGICSPRAAVALLAAGAAGVRLGTWFVASQEADFHPDYKAALVAARGADTVLTGRFDVLWPDAPHRVLRSAIDAAEAWPGDVVGTMSAGAQRIDVPRFAGFAPVEDADGAIEAMALFAGEGVGEITEILPAGEIVRRLEQAFAAALDRPLAAMQESAPEHGAVQAE